MSWAADTKLRCQVVAILWTFIGPGLLIWQAAETKRQFESRSWPSVPGEVHGTDAKTWLNDRKEVRYYGRVRYSYVVDGQLYATDLTDLGPGIKREDRNAALADVAHYQEGMPITVYYDPARPEVGVLENGIPDIHLYLLIGLVVSTLIGLVVSIVTVRGWLRGPKMKEPG